MKTLTAGLNSWKSTIAGLILAGLLVLQQQTGDGLQWDDPQLWVAVAIAVLGFLTRDADKSSQDAGIR